MFKLPISAILLALAAGTFPVSHSYAAIPAFSSPPGQAPTLAPMIESISAAVVNISVQSGTSASANPLLSDPFFQQFFNLPQAVPMQQQVRAAGSGVIIDKKNGIIVTNFHVIAEASKIVVHFSNGNSVEAELLGSDPEVDIAVLSIKDSKALNDQKEIPLADSDELRVGDFVVAIGNPFGLGQTVTSGLVSALGRTGLGIEGYENFIQTDASINPGNSGGALVNLSGELIGINTAILAPTGSNVGIGFAIPVNMMNASVDQILEHGEVRRGKIGVLIQDITPDIAAAFGADHQQKGVLVAGVQPESSAAQGGLEAGDIIISIDSKKTTSASILRNQVGLRKIGEVLKIDFLRDGKKTSVDIKIGDQNGNILNADNSTTPLGNLALEPRLSGIVFTQSDSNIEISEIEQDSPGSFTGLQAGDQIESLNRQDVASLSDLNKAIDKDKKILLRVLRNKMPLYIVIQ